MTAVLLSIAKRRTSVFSFVVAATFLGVLLASTALMVGLGWVIAQWHWGATGLGTTGLGWLIWADNRPND